MKILKINIILICLAVINYTAVAQWTFIEQNSGVTVNLTSISVSNQIGNGWICGYNGTVLKTYNSGSNWINVSGNGIPSDVNLVNIHPLTFNADLVHTCGNRGDTSFLYRTTNGGANWTAVLRQTHGIFNGVYFSYGSSTGFVIGNPVSGRWSIWKSTNNGLNWDSAGLYLPQNGTETGWNNSIFCFNTKLFFGTNNSRIYYSSNNGAAWTYRITPGEQNPSSIYFSQVYPDTGFTGYAGGTAKIIFTSNSGYSWQDAPALPGSGRVGGFIARPLPVENLIGFNDIIFIRNDNKLYYIPVYNTTVSTIYTAPSGTYTHISNRMPFPVWAVRNNGGITYCSCPISGIVKLSNEIPVSFTLSQNYPNPFNPLTTIEFNIPKTEKIALSLYDVTGRLVEVLANELVSPGRYSITWDGSNYSSGVYFYSLMTESFIETKRMVLVK